MYDVKLLDVYDIIIGRMLIDYSQLCYDKAGALEEIIEPDSAIPVARNTIDKILHRAMAQTDR